MTLWNLNVLIGEEKSKLYAMGKNLSEAEKVAWTRQHTKIIKMVAVFKSYKKGRKMSKAQQQNIRISFNQ